MITFVAPFALVVNILFELIQLTTELGCALVLISEEKYDNIGAIRLAFVLIYLCVCVFF